MMKEKEKANVLLNKFAMISTERIPGQLLDLLVSRNLLNYPNW